jgi:D-lactate dehydrogenase (cytochrome)
MFTMNAQSTLSLDATPPIHYDTTPVNLSGARNEFVTFLGAESIDEDQESCTARSGSRWSQPSPSHKAALVLYPKTTEDVSSILKVCLKRSIPVTPYSGGTGLSGSLAATRGGVCIDFRDMKKIWDLHESDMDITVQPGVGWMDLNAELAEKGLFFPPDPAPGARIGGMVSCPTFDYRMPSNFTEVLYRHHRSLI